MVPPQLARRDSHHRASAQGAPGRTDINNHFEQSGELPDGTAIDAENERFFIR